MQCRRAAAGRGGARSPLGLHPSRPGGESLMDSAAPPLIDVRDLVMTFPRPRGLVDRVTGQPLQIVRALDGVSFSVKRGETLGIVGESGCGKSTLARCLVRLHQPKAGSIAYDSIDVLRLAGAERRAYS